MWSEYDKSQIERMKESIQEKGDHYVLFEGKLVLLSNLLVAIETITNIFGF